MIGVNQVDMGFAADLPSDDVQLLDGLLHLTAPLAPPPFQSTAAPALVALAPPWLLEQLRAQPASAGAGAVVKAAAAAAAPVATLGRPPRRTVVSTASATTTAIRPAAAASRALPRHAVFARRPAAPHLDDDEEGDNEVDKNEGDDDADKDEDDGEDGDDGDDDDDDGDEVDRSQRSGRARGEDKWIRRRG